MIDQRGTSIEYQAKTKHLNLMYEISQTRNRSVRERNTRQATAIRYYIRALRFKDYLTDKQVNQIYQCLVSLADLYEFPVNPNLPTVEQPQQGTTIIIEGEAGPSGQDGGGTDYSALNIVTDTTVDEFSTSLAYAAEWTYDISDSSGNGRSGRVSAKWNSTAGTITAAVEYRSPDLGVSTSPVTFQTAIVSGNVRLIALVASGTWTIRGTRYLTPNGGILQVTPSVLASGNILVGNSSNVATSVALSGDGTISNTGVFAISSGVIVNADVNASAAIAWSKLAAGTTDRVVVTNTSTGLLEVSPITTTLLGYLSNVTSDIQDQIDALSTGTFTGAVSTILNSNLTVDRVLISNPAGKVAVSGVSVTNLNTLDTTTSLTTQLAAKLPNSGTNTYTGNLTITGNASVAAATLAGHAVNKTQHDLKLDKALAEHSIFVGNGSNEAAAVAIGSEGSFLRVESGTPTWQKITPVTSVITPSLGTAYASAAENYSVISCNVQIIVNDAVGTEEGEVALEVSPTEFGTYVIQGIFELRTVYGMAGDTAELQQTQQLTAIVPSGYYWKLRTVTNTAATITVRDSTETVY